MTYNMTYGSESECATHYTTAPHGLLVCWRMQADGFAEGYRVVILYGNWLLEQVFEQVFEQAFRKKCEYLVLCLPSLYTIQADAWRRNIKYAIINMLIFMVSLEVWKLLYHCSTVELYFSFTRALIRTKQSNWRQSPSRASDVTW